MRPHEAKLTSRLACAVVLSACGSSSDGGMTGHDAAVTGDAAVIDVPTGPRVRWTGVVYDLDPAKPVTTDDQPPLAGVEVCSEVAGEAPVCVTTASDGVWTLQFPAEREGVAFTTKRAGHASLVNLGTTLDSDELDLILFLPRESDVATFMTACGASEPGATAAGVLVQGYQRVTPAYVPLDGGTMTASAGAGPCYMESPWLFGDDLAATSAGGLGYGVFGSVPVGAGTVNVGVQLTDATCTASRDAAPVAGDGTLTLPVKAGYFTHLSVICE